MPPWPSLSDNIRIAGRDVPVVAAAAAAGAALFFVFRVTRKATAGTSASADTSPSALAGVTSLVEGLRGDLTNQTAQLAADIETVRTSTLQSILQNAATLRSEQAAGLAGVRADFTSSLSSVRADLQQLQADTQAALDQQATQFDQTVSGLTARVGQVENRLTAVEAKTARNEAAAKNVAVWLTKWHIPIISHLTPQQQQAAGSELTTNVTVPLGAYGNYVGYP